MLKLLGFTHTSSSDINLEYYHIKLYPGTKKTCIIVLPREKYKYQKLPMGVWNSAYIFSGENLQYLWGVWHCTRVNRLVITKNYFTNHLNALEKSPQKLPEEVLKVDTKK